MDPGAVVFAVSVRKRVHRHLAAGRVTREGLACLIDHREAGRQPDSGKDLDRLEDGERHRSHHQHRHHDQRSADPGGKHQTGRIDGHMRRFLLLMLALTACTLPGSQVEDGPGLEGTYVVNGVDPLGTEYSGTVVITEGSGVDRFEISWLITGAILEGTGVRAGDELVVEWRTREGPRGDSSGTALYRIGEDGILVGERLVDGLDAVGTEEIFPSG